MAVALPGVGGTLGFTLYLCAGLLPWMAFAEVLQRGSGTFLESATYLKKLPVPEEVFVARTALVSAFTLGLSMLLLLALALVSGAPLTSAWLAVPVVLALFLLLAFGLALLFGTLNVFLRDVGSLLAIVIQLWMWLTPIVYREEILPAGVRRALRFNPAYPYVDALHLTIVRGVWPDPAQWSWMLAWTAAGCILGTVVLSRLRSEIRDVL